MMRLVGLVALASLVPTVFGHGYISSPASRNYIANSDYCPQCLNAGGPGAVGAGGASWPSGVHGICGDPYTDPTPRPNEAGGQYWTGKIGGSYATGQVIDITVTVTAFHYGRFDFRICVVPASATDVATQTATLTEGCLSAHQLTQADVEGAQNPGDIYYHLESEQSSYTIPMQLPGDVTCDGVTSSCILQWHWTTGNSCNPSDEPARFIQRPQLSVCGQNGAYPEEFWNCADITITSSGSAGTPTTTPSPSPSPVPATDVPTTSNPSPPAPATSNPSPPAPATSNPSPPAPATSNPSPPAPVTSNPSPPAPATTIPSPPQPQSSPSSPSSSACSSGDAACYCANNGGALGMFGDVSVGCQKYYWCYGTGTAYMTCPSGTAFNKAYQVCDWINNFTCE